MKKVYILLALVFFGGVSAFSQVNIKIGAIGSYVQNEVNQSILNRFDKENPNMVDGFGPFEYAFGLQTGIRYTMEAFSLELSYQNMAKELEASGQIGTTDFIEENLFYSFNHFDLGFEHTIKKVGYGASIGYSFMNVKTNSNIVKKKVSIMNDYVLNSQFFLSLHIAETDIMELVLRPFVEIGWDAYNMNKLDKFINPTSTVIGTSLQDNVTMFGLSFVIYNGPQY